MKICVYAVAKNEAQFVERFCEAAKDADYIVVGDTGSTDDTVAKFVNIMVNQSLQRKAEIMVSSIRIRPWRFDKARDAVLASVPEDADVCLSLDLDEVLQPGWREEIERVWEVGKTTRMRYMFDWGWGKAFVYDKIHGRWGYYWFLPCHERPEPDPRITEVWVDSPFLMVVHKPDGTKSRSQYLDILAVGIKEHPEDPRQAFYYARELTYVGRHEDGIAECKRYLALPKANWANERCYAYRTMGRSYKSLGNNWEAHNAFLMAAAEAPWTREPWYELAWLMYEFQDWPACFGFASKCMAIANREAVYTVDPEVWGHKAHDILAISAYRMGVKDIAVLHGREAARLDEDPRYKTNLKHYEEMPECSDSGQLEKKLLEKLTSSLLAQLPLQSQVLPSPQPMIATST